MTVAIQTRYHGPTNTQPGRVSVTSNLGRKFFFWDSALNTLDNHKEAARRYLSKVGWEGTWHLADSLDGKGYVFVRQAADYSILI